MKGNKLNQIPEHFVEGLFTAYKIKVNIDGTKPVIFRFFSDIHYESSMCDKERWRACMKLWKKTHTPNTFYIGCGDYNDLACRGSRAKLKMAGLHATDVQTLDEIARKHTADFASQIAWMGPNLLGLIEGNHTWEYADQTSTGMDLCERLNCYYLGNLTYVILQCEAHNGIRFRFDLCGCHGKGGGKLAGTTINHIDDMKRLTPFADVYFQGHDHKKIAAPTTVLRFDVIGGLLKCKEFVQYLVRTGSFLRGYMPFVESYVAKAMYPPTALGAVELQCKVSRESSNKHQIYKKHWTSVY